MHPQGLSQWRRSELSESESQIHWRIFEHVNGEPPRDCHHQHAHCTDVKSEAQRGEGTTPQVQSPACSCRTGLEPGLLARASSRSWPHGIVLAACRPCHTRWPSSQPVPATPSSPASLGISSRFVGFYMTQKEAEKPQPSVL